MTADFNRDGRDDFLIASRLGGGRIEAWLSRATGAHQRVLVDPADLVPEAGGAVHDIDGDGDVDFVLGQDWSGTEIFWWENPYPNFGSAWTRRTIKTGGSTKHHDQVFGDFNGDGKVELVSWNQVARQLLMFEIPSNPRASGPWNRTVIATASSRSEGLARADIDGDGVDDIVGAGRWWRHTGNNKFTRSTIDAAMDYTRTAVGQFIPGGRPEVVFVPGDANGNGYFYEWTGGSWRKTLLGYFYHGHTLEVGDLDGDGNLDMMIGEMRLGRAACELTVRYGDGKGGFKTQLLATGNGVHEGRLADTDGDGDLDIVHKPYNDRAPRVELWRNDRPRLSLTQWRAHRIDDGMPHNAVFIRPGDLDGDGDVDAVAGGYWYVNPGTAAGNWQRRAIGAPFHNLAAVHDFDGDGDLDLFGTQGFGAQANARFAWAENDGRGGFTVRTNIQSGTGDFLQGVAVARFGGASAPLQIALSWHAAGQGIQMITVPASPTSQTWSWQRVTSVSEDEDLSVGDIDGDGDLDLMLGTRWLRMPGAQAFTIGRVSDLPGVGGRPMADRNELVDVDNDGDLDVVVSLELGRDVVWFENPLPSGAPTGSWRRHTLGNAPGQGFSLDTADFDRDGDVDVVLGEHRGSGVNRVLIFENEVKSHSKPTGWRVHVADSQSTSVIDHHDGTRAIDMDGDGDLDVLSVGWTRRRAWWFENLAIRGKTGSVVTPVVTPRGGSFRGFRTVTASTTTPGATIRYTTDGTVPTASSPAYTRPIVVNDTVWLRFRGFQNGLSPSEPTDARFARMREEQGYWRFDAGWGGVAFDDARNRNNGQLRGATWHPEGRVQGALEFRGAGHVSLGGIDMPGQALTLSAWIRPDRFDHLVSHDGRILSKATGLTEQEHYAMVSTIRVGSETRLRFRLKAGGSTATLIASSGNVPVREWSHVVAAYSGGHMILYLNGVEVGRMSKTGRIDTNPGAALWVGDQPVTAGRGFDGRIDEVRWFDRELSAHEVRCLALDTTEAGLMNYGRSTVFCGQNQRATATRAPTSGDTAFGLAAADVPPSAFGMVIVGQVPSPGVPLRNLQLFINPNPGNWVLTAFLSSDATGRLLVPISLQGVPKGFAAHVQFVWANPVLNGCPPPSRVELSATDALRITVQ